MERTAVPLPLQAICRVDPAERLEERRIVHAREPILVEVVPRRDHEIDAQLLSHDSHLWQQQAPAKIEVPC